MPSTTRDQALELAKTFRELSNQLGDYRFEHWGDLTPGQRKDIEDTEWTLLNHSSDFVTTAVGIDLDNVKKDLDAITRATTKAQKVLTRITRTKDILKVAAALVVLGGAIASNNPGTILAAAGDLYTTSEEALA